MVEIRQVSDKEQWDDFGLEHGAHPLQLWGWGQLKASHGWQVDRVFILEDEREVGAAQILIRKVPMPLRAFAYIPRGPITTEDWQPEYLNALADYVKAHHKPVALSIEPDDEIYDVPQGWHHAHNHILPSHTLILDLNKPEAELLNDMAKKTRQYIRKSAADGVEIKAVKTKEELQKCLEIYHTTAKRAGFALHADQYYYDVYNSLQDQSPVFAAYADGEPVAFLWLAVSGRTAFELYGGMNEKGQELRANYSLKWQVIRKTKEWGLERYDFGGLIEGGVSIFKRGWSEHETFLAGTYDKPLSSFYGVWNKGLPAVKRLVQRLRRQTS